MIPLSHAQEAVRILLEGAGWWRQDLLEGLLGRTGIQDFRLQVIRAIAAAALDRMGPAAVAWGDRAVSELVAGACQRFGIDAQVNEGTVTIDGVNYPHTWVSFPDGGMLDLMPVGHWYVVKTHREMVPDAQARTEPIDPIEIDTIARSVRQQLGIPAVAAGRAPEGFFDPRGQWFTVTRDGGHARFAKRELARQYKGWQWWTESDIVGDRCPFGHEPVFALLSRGWMRISNDRGDQGVNVDVWRWEPKMKGWLEGYLLEHRIPNDAWLRLDEQDTRRFTRQRAESFYEDGPAWAGGRAVSAAQAEAVWTPEAMDRRAQLKAVPPERRHPMSGLPPGALERHKVENADELERGVFTTTDANRAAAYANNFATVDDPPVVIAVDAGGLDPRVDVDATLEMVDDMVRYAIEDAVAPARQVLAGDEGAAEGMREALSSDWDGDGGGDIPDGVGEMLMQRRAIPRRQILEWLEEEGLDDRGLAQAIVAIWDERRIPERVLAKATDQYRYPHDIHQERILWAKLYWPWRDDFADYQDLEDWDGPTVGKDWPVDDEGYVLFSDEAASEAAMYGWLPERGTLWQNPQLRLDGVFPSERVEYHGTTLSRARMILPDAGWDHALVRRAAVISPDAQRIEELVRGVPIDEDYAWRSYRERHDDAEDEIDAVEALRREIIQALVQNNWKPGHIHLYRGVSEDPRLDHVGTEWTTDASVADVYGSGGLFEADVPLESIDWQAIAEDWTDTPSLSEFQVIPGAKIQLTFPKHQTVTARRRKVGMPAAGAVLYHGCDGATARAIAADGFVRWMGGDPVRGKAPALRPMQDRTYWSSDPAFAMHHALGAHWPSMRNYRNHTNAEGGLVIADASSFEQALPDEDWLGEQVISHAATLGNIERQTVYDRANGVPGRTYWVSSTYRPDIGEAIWRRLPPALRDRARQRRGQAGDITVAAVLGKAVNRWLEKTVAAADLRQRLVEAAPQVAMPSGVPVREVLVFDPHVVEPDVSNLREVATSLPIGGSASAGGQDVHAAFARFPSRDQVREARLYMLGDDEPEGWDFDRAYDAVIEQLSNFTGEVWRSLSLDDDQSIEPEGHRYWTWDRDVAEDWGGTRILHGQVDLADVDWLTTIVLNMEDTAGTLHEHEIRVREGAPVHVIDIDGVPADWTATAHRVVADRRLLWHGTSDVVADAILSQGLGQGKEKVWGAGTDMESLSGVYLTDNVSYAVGSAGQAVKKMGGQPLIVGVVLDNRDADVVLDEDQFLYPVVPHGSVSPDDPAELAGIVDNYLADLARGYPSVDARRIEALRPVVEAYVRAYSSRFDLDGGQEAFRKAEDDLIRASRWMVHFDGREPTSLVPMRTPQPNVRVTTPVTYRGSKRVVLVARLLHDESGLQVEPLWQSTDGLDPRADDPVDVLRRDLRSVRKSTIQFAFGAARAPANSRLRAAIEALLPEMAAAAQFEYDRWSQDEDGEDPELGTGGICDRIDFAVGAVLEANIPNIATADGSPEGEDHAWSLVTDGVEVYQVDLPAHVYERGGGYRWTKIPDVVIEPGHFAIDYLGPFQEWEEVFDSYGADTSSLIDRQASGGHRDRVEASVRVTAFDAGDPSAPWYENPEGNGRCTLCGKTGPVWYVDPWRGIESQEGRIRNPYCERHAADMRWHTMTPEEQEQEVADSSVGDLMDQLRDEGLLGPREAAADAAGSVRVHVIPAGALLYHGTGRDFSGPSAHLYVTDRPDLAAWHANKERGSSPRVITYRATRDLRLAIVEAPEDRWAILEASGWDPYYYEDDAARELDLDGVCIRSDASQSGALDARVLDPSEFLEEIGIERRSAAIKILNPLDTAEQSGDPDEIEDALAWVADHPKSLTARLDIELPPTELVGIPGARGEENKIDEGLVERLAASMRATGFNPDKAPMIVVEADGRRLIWEGNHRVRAAVKAGIATIPVDVRYFGGAERLPDAWRPDLLHQAAAAEAPAWIRKLLRSLPIDRGGDCGQEGGYLVRAANGFEILRVESWVNECVAGEPDPHSAALERAHELAAEWQAEGWPLVGVEEFDGDPHAVTWALDQARPEEVEALGEEDAIEVSASMARQAGDVVDLDRVRQDRLEQDLIRKFTDIGKADPEEIYDRSQALAEIPEEFKTLVREGILDPDPFLDWGWDDPATGQTYLCWLDGLDQESSLKVLPRVDGKVDVLHYVGEQEIERTFPSAAWAAQYVRSLDPPRADPGRVPDYFPVDAQLDLAAAPLKPRPSSRLPGFKEVTLPAGTRVYHGTSQQAFSLEPRPIWVSRRRQLVECFADDGCQDDPGRIVTFVTTRPVDLLYFKNEDDLERLFDALQVAPTGFNTGNYDLLNRVCADGYDGWMVRDYEGMGDDIALCTPQSCLEQTKIQRFVFASLERTSVEAPRSANLWRLLAEDDPELAGGEEMAGEIPLAQLPPGHRLRQVVLGDLIRVAVGDPNADFWIERRGSPETVGRPSREPGPQRYGITVTRPDVVLPDYLYYVFEHLWRSGQWEAISRGTTRLVNIRVRDILEIPLAGAMMVVEAAMRTAAAGARVLYHVTPWRNVKSIVRRGLVPSAGRRGFAADNPDEPRIYLFEDRDTAEDALTNWIVDEIPDERWFAIFPVAVSVEAVIYDDPELAGSYYVTEPISASDVGNPEKVDAGDPEDEDSDEGFDPQAAAHLG